MKTTNVVGSIVGLVCTIAIIFSLKPTSVMAFTVFALWSGAPFIVTLVLSIIHKNTKGVGVGIYLSVFIGFILYMDILFWHPDAQGGLAVLALPFLFFSVIVGALVFVKGNNT